MLQDAYQASLNAIKSIDAKSKVTYRKPSRISPDLIMRVRHISPGTYTRGFTVCVTNVNKKKIPLNVCNIFVKYLYLYC